MRSKINNCGCGGRGVRLYDSDKHNLPYRILCSASDCCMTTGWYSTTPEAAGEWNRANPERPKPPTPDKDDKPRDIMECPDCNRELLAFETIQVSLKDGFAWTCMEIDKGCGFQLYSEDPAAFDRLTRANPERGYTKEELSDLICRVGDSDPNFVGLEHAFEKELDALK